MSSIWVYNQGGRAMIIDTTNWTEEDWLVYESAGEHDKMATAIEIGEKYGNL